MSWFKHNPRPKNPPKLHVYHSSPTTEKLLKETKIKVNSDDKQKVPKKNK